MVINGTTKSGIGFKIDNRIKDDVRLLYVMTKVQNPKTTPEEASELIMKLLSIIFGGDEGSLTFMNAVADVNNGVCDTTVMIKELKEILEACKLKNSSTSHKSSTSARKK